MSSLIRRTLCLLAAVIAASPVLAQDVAGNDIRSLDGQVQEIKSDVLQIASDLNVLEERLLYPSNTQLAVFVALDGGDDFRLDSVKIDLDGEAVTHHIYAFNELEALQKGGVQRIYTGNVATGEHQIAVTMSGKLKNGTDFEQAESFVFTKGVKPKTLGITLARSEGGNGGIRFGDW